MLIHLLHRTAPCAIALLLVVPFVSLGCSSSSSEPARLPDASPSDDSGASAVVELHTATMSLVVDPTNGARITSLRVGATELLTSSDVNLTNYGSTFWPSPQAAWPPPVWPPPGSIDSEPYQVVATSTAITLTGERDAKTQLRVTKKLTADPAHDAFVIDYTMANEGSAAVSWAPWEITRMPASGLTFWPTGGAPFAGTQALLPSQDVAGHTWIDAKSAPMIAAKLYADGSGGWLAQIVGDAILIKQFMDQPATAAAPHEGEIEVYLDGAHRYVEVEPQGAFAPIPPGASVTWTVKWYARRLPSGLVASVGSADLIAFVTHALE